MGHRFADAATAAERVLRAGTAMPVDFSNLPPEEPVPDKPPSRWLWTVIFFVIVIVGVFAVLFLWPAGEPTHTPWFWSCLVVYPVGIASFVVLRRHSAYQGARLGAIARNEARSQYVNEVFNRASYPVAVLATAYRFSSDPDENDLAKVLSGTLKLVPKTTPASTTEPVNARWIIEPDADDDARYANDTDRQQDILRWMFDGLLNDIEAAIRLLPDDAKLSVRLMISASAPGAGAEQCWDRLWSARGLTPVRTAVEPVPVDAMWLDTWLDHINKDRDREVRLLVVAQLYPAREGALPDGGAEAAAAILLVPPSLVEQFHLVSVAEIHRPEESSIPLMEDALRKALQWGRAEPGEIERIWQSGLERDARAAITKACVKTGISGKFTDVDSSIGYAGAAASWLTIACAARAAATEKTAQLVVTSLASGPQLCVVRSDSA